MEGLVNYDDLVRRLDAIVNGDGPKPPWSIAGLTSIVTPSGDMFLTSDRGDHTNDWTRQKVCDAINLAGQAAAAIQELQRDALRYRWLRDFPCNHFHLTRNDDNATNYVTAKQWIEEYDPEDFEDCDPAEVQKMKDMDTIWRFQIYPATPIGFNVYHGATLDTAIDKAMQHEGG